MPEAVIVATARTPIGRAFRGALNNIKSPTLMAHAIRGEHLPPEVISSYILRRLRADAERNRAVPSEQKWS